MKSISHHCERHVLSQSPMVNVECCDCGIVHVTLAAVTLRFDPGALRALRDTLDEAVTALSLHRAPRHVRLRAHGAPRGSA